VQNRRRRAPWKADLKWFLVFAALAQLGLVVVMDWRRPDLYDLEYGKRLALLRRRQAEAPERPLALVVGSSRVGLGFLPEQLPPIRSASGEPVLPFNFSHLAAGPVFNLVELRRLLREGIRPRWVVLEVAQSCMAHEGASTPVTMSSAADLPVLQRYFSPAKVWGVYLRGRLNPWYSHRLGILRQCAPCWATDAGGEDRIVLGPLGGDGGWMLEDRVDDETRRRRTDAVRAIYLPTLHDYRIDPMTDRALREGLDLCRKEGIECALLVTPESSEYRSWYGADGMASFDRYCGELSEEYGVPVVDARRWLTDDQFCDGHHPLRPGAEAFTERLGREALRPLVEGRLGHGAAACGPRSHKVISPEPPP
jgi:hypothetical protein